MIGELYRTILLGHRGVVEIVMSNINDKPLNAEIFFCVHENDKNIKELHTIVDGNCPIVDIVALDCNFLGKFSISV